ncbi:MAG: alpha/beta hydrolase, partial [Sneathiella sp.]|nr:alpha/beta hydrolase [Sneathiella sp.]
MTAVRNFSLCLFLGLLLMSCTPVVQQAGTAAAEPELNSHYLQTFDGKRLPLKTWAAEDPKAVIVAVHGFNDYSNTYAFCGSWWLGQGLTTVAYDQRGFGEGPEFGIWPG